MKLAIIGAGRLGKELARTLSYKKNDIVVVDISADLLERLRDRHDVMTVHGDGASFEVLKRAGIDNGELLIAVTGSDASNVLACQIAKHCGVRKTICRLSSGGFFSEEAGFPATAVGIDHLIFPEDMCVSRILGVLEHRSLVERLVLGEPDVYLSALRISSSSLLAGVRISEFPDRELLANIRFSAIVRNQRLLTPRGDTRLQVFDEVYVAGTEESLRALIKMSEPNTRSTSLVIVAGGTRIGRKVVSGLLDSGYTVRLIEKDLAICERLLSELGQSVMVLNGDPTEAEVQEEAGVSECGAFIGALSEDENNILSCLLAREHGAGKTVAITTKAEYMDIVSAMAAIDCGFSPRLVAVNAVLNLLGSETGRVHAMLHRVHAYVYEFDVQPGSWACNRQISKFHRRSPNSIFSAVFRQNRFLPAVGELELQAGDRVMIVGMPKIEHELVRLFKRKGWAG